MTEECAAAKGGPLGSAETCERCCDSGKRSAEAHLSGTSGDSPVPSEASLAQRPRQSAAAPNSAESARGSVAPHVLKSELELVPVTSLTPISPSINLDVKLGADGGQVQLLPVTLGKGAFGRVVVGLYGGKRVAVKLLNTGLMFTTPDAKVWASEALMAIQSAAASRHHAGDAPAAAGHGAADAGGQVAHQAASQGEEDGRARAAGRAFGQEVAVLARCEHPNIVRLLAASLELSRPCLVMELMDTCLDRLLYGARGGGAAGEGVNARRPGELLPLPKVLSIVMQIGRALSYLHPTVLHRDLKPANVLVSNAESDTPIVKLGDFGLARLNDTVLVTQHPEAGTTPYVAPEAFDPFNFTIRDRADIYSLGVILWELLAGMRPWAGQTDMQALSAPPRDQDQSGPVTSSVVVEIDMV
ncbi:hypothetical protein GPECTOR_1g83 [Gonium pectorale]|uniref:Protein kinase domain-containing protein n=1 Tax=Gonium pectorale TaxID=33097 RepID=A0A150H5L4_GONPE|nr:hypothetical protein GPECTOR_1g83 [Gonium pectorale]|eukprot:KXZ56920.1 hypothetical protein GPECTOR_1g83 [Gonium pectorale]